MVDIPWRDGSEFIWIDGNFACDCNRGLFFANAAGEHDPDCDCGHERYRVPYALLIPGGERVEIDGGDDYGDFDLAVSSE